MRFINYERTRVAYRVGDEGHEFNVVAEPGVNEVSDDVARLLANDEHFNRHAIGGFIVILDDDGQPVPVPDRFHERVAALAARRKPDPAVVAHVNRTVFPTAAQVALAESELNADREEDHAEVIAPAGPSQADVDFLKAWGAMDEATRAAMLPTLDEHNKALVAPKDGE